MKLSLVSVSLTDSCQQLEFKVSLYSFRVIILLVQVLGKKIFSKFMKIELKLVKVVKLINTIIAKCDN